MILPKYTWMKPICTRKDSASNKILKVVENLKVGSTLLLLSVGWAVCVSEISITEEYILLYE